MEDVRAPIVDSGGLDRTAQLRGLQERGEAKEFAEGPVVSKDDDDQGLVRLQNLEAMTAEVALVVRGELLAIRHDQLHEGLCGISGRHVMR